jgi:trimethylamine monooxygenase
VIHAHDFRDALTFKGQDLLIVGASYSAEDIALQCWKYGAKSVTMTYRTAAMGFDWPETMEERPLLQRLDGDVAHFADGSSKRVDAIILCTGYQHHFPFMADALKLRTTNRLYSPGLWKGVVWAADPGVFYLGMQDQWYTFTMFDAEAWFARDVILGRIAVPAKVEMEADMAAWAAREAEADDAYKAIDFQAAYVKELADRTDYPDFDVASTVASFKAWKKDKQKSITGYRDKAFPSAVTGTMSPTHSVKWVEAMDDSVAAFMGVAKAAE